MSNSVAIVIESLGGGGAQHVAANLANAWAVDGLALTVITFQPPAADKFHLDRRIQRLVIGGAAASSHAFAAIGANIGRLVRLRAALKASRADVIVAFVGSTNILTVLASRGLRRRVVISERNDPSRQSLGRAWDWLRRRVYRHADLTIANSHEAIEAMATYVPRERMVWLPNPLRTAPEHPGFDIPLSGPFFLAVGRLHAQKAYDILLGAFAALSTELPDWKLVILGDGPLRSDLLNQAERLSIAPRVRFMGFVENPFPWYRAATAFVHPAIHEGLPNAVLEAMSEGLPVIVTGAQHGLRDIVRDGETGLVVPTGAAAPLAQAMLGLARDAALRNSLGRQARAALAPFQTDSAAAAWRSAVLA